MESFAKIPKPKNSQETLNQSLKPEKNPKIPSLESLQKINKNLQGVLITLSAALAFTVGDAGTAHSAETITGKLSSPSSSESEPTGKVPNDWVDVNKAGKITIKNPNAHQENLSTLPLAQTKFKTNYSSGHKGQPIKLNHNYRPLKPISNNFNMPNPNNSLGTPTNQSNFGTPTNQQFPSNVHVGPNQNISPDQISADPTSEVSIGGFQETN